MVFIKYYDYAATKYPDKNYIKFLLDNYDNNILFGNPSSVHFDGIKAKQILEQTRELIADCLNCYNNNIVFTSGGTESDNMAIKGIMLKYKPEEAELITSEFEHHAVLNTCKQLENMGYKIHYIKPTSMGLIEPKAVCDKLNDKTKMVSIMKVNNEIGTIQPINQIAKSVHEYNSNIVFHSDMVQSIPFVLIDFKDIDLASFSGHKFGGLKGTGFLYKKEHIDLLPIIVGGEQENGQRAGTENIFGNIIMARALKCSTNNCTDFKLWSAKQKIKILVNLLKEQFNNNMIINGDLNNRVPNNLNVSFKNIDGKTLQYKLSQQYSIYVSTGSACSSNSNEVSHVLKAINTPKEYQNGNIRITLPLDIEKTEIKDLAKCIIKCVKSLQEGGDF